VYTRVGQNGGIGTYDRNIQIATGGVFEPVLRWPLIFAVTEVAGQTQSSYHVSGGVQRHGTLWSATMWTGPSRIHVARFHNHQMQGDLAVHITQEGAGGWGCEQILGSIGAAIGNLNPMLGHILGMLTGTCG